MNPLYELVPISEKPEKIGVYHLMGADKEFRYSNEYDPKQFGKKNKGWFLYNNPANIAYYLKPINPETLKAKIREELGKCWSASGEYNDLVNKGTHPMPIDINYEAPDRETYINSVIDNLFKQ